MTLANAIHHPWLQSYTPVYDHRPFTATPSASSIPTDDVSMLSSIPEGDRSVGNVSGALPPWNGIKREGSRTAPLQRRSRVLSQAAEGDGAPLVEPSWEMIAHATSQARSQAAGPSNWAANKGNKRVHSELTPLSELEDADMNGTSPSSNSNLSPRKKGKNSDDESLELGIAGRLARGRAKAAVEAASAPANAKAKVPRARAKGGVASDDDNGLSVRLRRSNRQLPKVARRA
jgi:serine/threonine/tyrosine protein kinase RAD53